MMQLDKQAHIAVSAALTLAGALLFKHWLLVAGVVLLIGASREGMQALTAWSPRIKAWCERWPLVAYCCIGNADGGDMLANLIGVALALVVCGVAGVAV